MTMGMEMRRGLKLRGGWKEQLRRTRMNKKDWEFRIRDLIAFPFLLLFMFFFVVAGDVGLEWTRDKLYDFCESIANLTKEEK